MGRNFIVSIAANTGLNTFSAGVSTAFTQGKKHRTLWIQLPANATKMLGLEGGEGHNSLMQLCKPMLVSMDFVTPYVLGTQKRMKGSPSLQQCTHYIDPCLFLVHDNDAPEEWTSQKNDNENTVKHLPWQAFSASMSTTSSVQAT